MSQVEESYKIPPNQRDKVRNLIEKTLEGKYDEREEPHCEYCLQYEEDDQRLIVRQFSNGTLQMQGNAVEKHSVLVQYLKNLLKQGCSNRHSPRQIETNLCPFPHIGTDEAGKGDYFGPLVVAAVHLEPEECRLVRQWGMGDSKTISDKRCKRLGQKLKEKLSDSVAFLVIRPSEYNEKYSEFQTKGRNLNDLLACAHLQVIEQLISKLNGSLQKHQVLVDKFANEDLLAFYLSEHSSLSGSIDLKQVVRAERDAAVACASILARAVFLECLDEISEQAEVDLPKGGGTQTVTAGRRLVKKHGEDFLSCVAKIHFSNTSKIFT